ncbi:MAG: radical SAM protein, partial [Propionibacteriales bacterium]|nr:radical SAM protein [Propionibacteriales bacterium]
MSVPAPRVSLVTLGCARNEVDSDELAGRLAADGWELVKDPTDADIALVNTCGFIEAAQRDSIDTILDVAQGANGRRAASVVAVGCLAERYGAALAESLPEAQAVLGFDDYPAISQRLRTILDGGSHRPHQPRDRRRLLPLAPAERPGPPSGPPRVRLTDGPTAVVKLASGCDRRCSFCAIPSFRGAFQSRPPDQIVAEAQWLAEGGARELYLVSENTTSYGKDLGDLRLLETLLPQLAAIAGVERVRVSYLQPAEMRASLVEVMASTPGVAPYFD